MVAMRAVVRWMSIAAASALAACASVPLADKESDAAGKRFDPPPPGSARLYAYQAACTASTVRPVGTVFVVDQGSCGTDDVHLRRDDQPAQKIGRLAPMNWLSVDVAPGSYDIWCGEGAQRQKLDLKAGEQVFVALVRTKENDFLGLKGFVCIAQRVDASGAMAAIRERRRARTS